MSAPDLTQKNNNFITRTTDGVVSLLDILERLDAIYTQYVSLDYGNPDTGITDKVLAGSSSQHLDRQMFIDGIASLEALKTFIQSGHGTNFERFRR